MSTRTSDQPVDHNTSHELGGDDVVSACNIASSAPAIPKLGSMYFDNALNRIYVYDGSGWGYATLLFP